MARAATILGSLCCAVILVLTGCRSSDSTATLTASPSTSTTMPAGGTPPASLPAAPVETAIPNAGVHCGTERWPVKTLSDSDTGSVDFTPVATTVSDLRSIPAPATLPDASRTAPTELTVYTVTASAVEFKLEEDRDVHLVIAEPNDLSQTMITEFPDATDCLGAVASGHSAEMIGARQALTATFGQPSSSHFTTISATVTLTGVGFFDFQHGQTGVAPNAIELHPVLSFSVTGAPAPISNSQRPPNTTFEYPCETSDCNCPDFPTHAEAQRIFEKHGGSPGYNWSGLDRDHDGIACESLP